MLRGEFAAAIVAMLAIVTAVIMDEPLAGLLVVLMQFGGEALDRYAFARASSSLALRAPRWAGICRAGLHDGYAAVQQYGQEPRILLPR